ncbi:LacI family DNA-binding transcriptional regulator [Homoserinibacter sp. YIM 151385]|uniref:LacI family DNA-binding transcriptional regulator n=1 Tax=Homoserinibacter sp. YIM 151385 TaxID=2985506 RepID=UPI0022F03951|nr:LacI family DNA-binding transcriptional regulator [Homoserinibacter sp. YIM 151385]WBU38192.1 LacI family DNA-binding transcriptional regulator [Homoserinibacter sp. YIM 151385]
MSERPRATLQDVAGEASVSLKTASRAVNNEPHVSQATRDRVLAAARRLGFQLNTGASLLARGLTSNSVGLVTGDLANPFYAALAKGIESELRTRGMQVTLASSDESPEIETALVGELARRQVRAVIVVSTLDDHGEYASLLDRGIPLVFVDRPASGIEADSVVIDDAAGGRLAAEHLLAAGHRRIAFLGDYDRLPTFRGRLAGFRGALEAAGVSAPELERAGAHDPETAAARTRELLALDARPTAIFASNNRATIGALAALGPRRDGPALVGFDDFELAAYAGITVVRHDPVAMGRQAALLALGRLEAPDAPAQRLVLPVELIARGSGERPPG